MEPTPAARLRDEASALTAPPERLGVLAASRFAFVQEAALQNPGTPLEVVLQHLPAHLETENDNRLFRAIIQNPALPGEALAQIAERLLPEIERPAEDNVFQRALLLMVLLFQQPGMPFATIERTLHLWTASRHFRLMACNVNRADVLELLMQDRSPRVRRRAQRALLRLSESK